MWLKFFVYLHSCPFRVALNSHPLSDSLRNVMLPLLSPIKQCLDAVSYLKLMKYKKKIFDH